MTGARATRQRAMLSVAGFVVVVIVAALAWLLADGGDPAGGGSATPGAAPSATSAAAGRASSTNPAVPDHVLTTLAFIDAGEWPEAANAPGTHGGDVFRNSEGNLPATDAQGRRITYREWDVNPKKPGQSRDAERIVTGSDGTAWYTDDHYRTFVRIRGPDQ